MKRLPISMYPPSVRVDSVVITTVAVGKGTPDDVRRQVLYVHDMDGELIARKDECPASHGRTLSDEEWAFVAEELRDSAKGHEESANGPDFGAIIEGSQARSVRCREMAERIEEAGR